MKLIDKDALVAKINKRIIDAPVNNIGHQRVWADNDVKDIINTLEVKEVQEEPVSEDLEEAASRYAKEEYNRKSPATLPDRCKGCYAPLKYAFKAGAKWKEEQLEKNLLAHCDAQTEEEAELERDFITSIIKKEHRLPTFDDAIKYGMRLQKEQMMAKTIDGEVGYWNLRGLSVNVELPHSVEEGDKVKVIVIKED